MTAPPAWLLGLALASGSAAAFNPCGVGLLPGYLGVLLGARAPSSRAALARQGIGLGLAMTGGILVPFVVLAATFGALAGWVGSRLPQIGMAVGALLLLWGGAALWQPQRFQPSLGLPWPRGSAGPAARLPAVWLYGFGFGLASLGCTFPLFLSLLSQAGLAGGAVGGAAVVLTYGVGMGLTVTLLTLAVRLGGGWLAARLRAGGPWFYRISGLLMALSGALVLHYWLA